MAGGSRVAKRRAEDELLVLFERRQQAGDSRSAFADSIGVPIGTLDGVLSRARKRRRGGEA